MSTLEGPDGVFQNVKRVEFVGIPVLEMCVIPSAFECLEDVMMEGVAGVLVEWEEERRRRKREEEERKKEEEERRRRAAEEAARRAALMAKKNPVICNRQNWEGIVPSLVEVLVVKDNCCSNDDIRVLDLSGFVNLRELKVGDWCFNKVEELKLIGMKCLERVVIGQVSFVKNPYNTADGRDDKRHFYLKNCPKLKSLKIGLKAFMDYSVIEIENVDALEVIEMGDLNEVSASFWYASLVLKSILIQNE